MSTKVSTDLIDLSGNTGGLVWAKGITAQQPASATAGEMRVDTTTNTTVVYTGTQWKTLKETAFVVPPVPTHFLVVAGGGGGGPGYQAAGGGAGGLRTSYGSFTGGGGSAESTTGISLNTAYTITVGDGGLGGTAVSLGVFPTAKGFNGSDSIFSNITSTGGGGGASYMNTRTTSTSNGFGKDGGSGGGAANSTSAINQSGGAATTPTQGYAGGSTSSYAATDYGMAGGGGAGGAGESVTSGGITGDGGLGLSNSITSSSVLYAGGGGGGNYGPTGSAGSGGSNIGGDGKDSTQYEAGESGVWNTGSGGGGASQLNTKGGDGSSGVVILRYPTADLPYFTTTGTLNTPSATDTLADAAYPVTNLAYYKLDSNANDSGLGSGYIGQGGIFNGSSSKIVTSSKILDNKTNLTISLWIKDLGNANYTGIIAEGGNSGQAGYVLAAYPDNTTLEFWRSSGDNVNYVFVGGSYNFGLGNYWTHIAITVTPSEVKYYKNGVNVKTTSITNTSTVSSAYNTTLMHDAQYNRYNSGTLDQVRIYDTALSSSNVALLYAETSATSSTLNYPAGTGGIALYEFSGNANDTGGTYNGTATNVLYAYNGTATDVTYGNGRFNEAAVFNGSSSYIDTNATFTPDLMSFSAWVNPTNGSSTRDILSNRGGNSTNYKGIDFGITSNGNIYSRFDNGGSRGSSNSDTVPIPLNTWTHLAFTIDMSNSIQKVYKNGVFVYQETTSGSIAPGNDFYIGRYYFGSSAFWQGSIDQVRIFSSALAPGDVEDLYNEHFQTKFTDGSDTALKFTGGTGDITFFDTAADYLVVAGGGGGGGGITGDVGGSGGAGAVIYQTAKLDTSNQYTLNIGLGGAGGGGNSRGVNGQDSYISLSGANVILAKGGGGGGSAAGPGLDGGSGGGGTRDGDSNSSQAGGNAVSTNVAFGGASIYGNNGGTGNGAYSGSGGGAGAAGTAGDGGVGIQINIDGNNYYWGGGAGGDNSTSGGNGGLGGGAGGTRLGLGGGSAINTGANATNDNGAIGGANTGGGGSGGLNSTNSGGSGGSGIIILRYPNTKTITLGAGLTATTAADGTDSVTTFTAGTGTITFS